MAALDYLQIKNSKDLPGKWREYIGSQAWLGVQVEPGQAFAEFKSLSEFTGKIYMELGCGRGHFLNALASEKPEDFFLGVEGRSSVVLRALELTAENQLSNLLFIPEFILKMEDHFAEGELDGIYLNFSDPWPKKRHHDHRIFNNEFIEALVRTLKPGGELHFATDHLPYFEEVLAALRADGRFQEMPAFEPIEAEKTDFEMYYIQHVPIGRCSFQKPAPDPA